MTGKLHAELVAGSGPGCKVCAFLDSLDGDAAMEWEVELTRPVSVVGNSAVERALRKRGCIVTEASVRRHRRHHTNG